MPKNSCIMQIWAESGKSALLICNYSQILYQFLMFTQNLKRSRLIRTKLYDTTLTSIALSVFVANLFKIQSRILFTFLWLLELLTHQSADFELEAV